MTASVLGIDLGAAYHSGRGGPGGWWILFEPELHLGEDVLVPDLGGWRRDRMSVPPSSSAFTVAPDLICEVVSPGTERLDRTRKLPAYARAGVPHAWLVNPLARTLEVLRLEAGHWLVVSTHAGDEIVRAEPFEAAALDLLAHWAKPARLTRVRPSPPIRAGRSAPRDRRAWTGADRNRILAVWSDGGE